ncbi:MAG TPA: hypothetical protein VJL81_09610 [Solirubrobacterales bacterium]|nr:hypothetical protein [Solirubrobacterales bacterium]
MAEIGFIDQTLRDGPQSLWGMRMRAQHATPALPHLNATGFDTIDLLGATSMVVMLRESGDDPWAWVDHLIRNLPDQPLRSALRPVAAGSFGFVPEGMLDLWIEVLVKHGVESHWLFDCLYDMPLMKERTRALQAVGGEVVLAIMYGLSELHSDEFFADRAREMASWPGVKRIYVEDAPGVLTPERAATLLPVLQEATPGVRLEIHSHNTTGLALLVYREGIKAGIDLIHTATMPLADAPRCPRPRRSWRSSRSSATPTPSTNHTWRRSPTTSTPKRRGSATRSGCRTSTACSPTNTSCLRRNGD